MAVLKAFDFPVPEQAIVVPKESKSSRRCFVPEFCFLPMGAGGGGADCRVFLLSAADCRAEH